MNKIEALAHALIAIDKLHAEGDLPTDCYVLGADMIKHLNSYARYAASLDELVNMANNPLDKTQYRFAVARLHRMFQEEPTPFRRDMISRRLERTLAEFRR